MTELAEILPPQLEALSHTHVQSGGDMKVINDNNRSSLYFPVELAPVESEGVIIPGWNALKRSDTGDHLFVHKKTYQLVSNEEVYSNFDLALTEAGLMAGNVEVKDELSHNGLRAFRQYIFKDYTIDPGDGNEVALRLVVFNSYDGSTSFRARIGGYRFICSNGCITGKDLLNISQKHTKGFELEKITEKVAEAPALFFEQEARWKSWQKVNMTTEDSIALFKKLPLASERLTDNLTRRLVESHYGHQNLWDVYNILTNWASHDKATTNTPSVVAQREERVCRLTNSHSWMQFEIPQAA